MTAQVFNIRDYQSKPDKRDLERQALEILNLALIGNDEVIYESSLGYVPFPMDLAERMRELTKDVDTAPSEYTAPDKDSA